MIASLAYGFALAVVGGRIGLRWAPQRRWIALAGTAAGAAVAALPIRSVPVAGWLAGIAGDLSITSLVLLVVALAGVWVDDAAKWLRMPTWLIAVAAGAGLLLWLVLWRVLPGDLYGLGYAPGLAGGIALGAIVGFAGPRAPVVAVALGLGAAAWWAGVGPSPNLWDSILDPWLVLAAWIELVRRVRRRREDVR